MATSNPVAHLTPALKNPHYLLEILFCDECNQAAMAIYYHCPKGLSERFASYG